VALLVAEFGEGEELVGDEGDDGVEADEHYLRPGAYTRPLFGST